jgi:hypothetical protein
MKKLSDLRERCWPGYKSVEGKKAYSPGSCVKEDLRKWFDKDHPEGGWKRINSKGEAIGPCAREPGEPKPKCMSNEKRAKLSKKERASAVASKRKHDPNPERKGEPINVSNFGKGKISENMENLEEKNVPTSPEKWAQAKSQAKAKFDVYPSAYANGWAAKKYKEMGGGWKSVSEDVEQIEEEQSDTSEKNEMAQTQLHFINYASKEILDYIWMGGEIEEWYQNKLSKVQSEVESLHSYIEGEKRRTGMVDEAHQVVAKTKDGENFKSAVYPTKKQAMDMHYKMAKGNKYVKVDTVKVQEETLEEGRPSQRHPLEGHDYHKKTDAELIHIAKDAHKAAEAMKSHNTTAENKYRDQANDSATVRYFRQKNGMPEWYKKKYGHMKEEVEQIDEISKTTLGSYVKRASQDAVTKAMKYASKRDESGKESGTLKKISDRESGIRKASDRLTKEEVEQIDELSKKTLGSYIKKSSDSLDTHSYMAGKSGDDEDYIKSLKRKQGINKATDRLTKEEVGMAEADKHSLIGKMQRGYELRKKVDSTYKDIGIAQKAGNHPEASKAFRKHERYANLERPGTWTKVDEQGVVESSMGHVTIDSPGHRLHGKKADVFHKHEDGRVNVQIRHSNRKGDVTNLTLKPNQFKMNEQVADAPFDPPYSKKTGSQTDKSGAKHGPMSTAKHLARMALAKQARTPAKKTDDRKTSIVREAMADAKKRDAKKKDEKKMDGSNNDKFQADPELTTQKLNNF